jgi:uncharacterized membrane protein YphA (DoxX/SURF4 family)
VTISGKELEMTLRNLPLRLVTGAYIAHTGWEKWHGSEEQAAGIHGMATGAYPFFTRMKSTDFLKLLSVGEMVTGGLLLAPFVPTAVAGAALTGFAGALVGMYLRTPSLHKPGSIWPTQQGIAVSKDAWMLGIGVSLLADAASRRGSR